MLVQIVTFAVSNMPYFVILVFSYITFDIM